MGGGGCGLWWSWPGLASFVVAAAVPAAVGNGWQLTQLDRMMQLIAMNRIEKKYKADDRGKISENVGEYSVILSPLTVDNLSCLPVENL